MAQIYLLDTNAASDVMKGSSTAVRQALVTEASSGVIAISAITAAELRFGIRKRGSSRLQAAFDKFCAAAEVLPWDNSAAEAYGELRYALTRRGITLDAMDLLIAAHAVSLGAVVVTHDQAFQQITDFVKVVDWAAGLIVNQQILG
jgi:tRNA(fMet)-specific endonuclease VapC